MEMLQPKLRFPEFESTWETKSLIEIASKPKYGLNSSATEYDGVNGYIRITDIDENSRKFIKNKITSPDEFDDTYLLVQNDLLFTRTGASTGKSYLYDEKDGKLYFAGFLIKFNINNANPNFIFYQTLLSKYDKWVRVMSMRSGQPGINAEEYSSLPLIIPTIEEQTRIANFLSSVDEKLNLLKEKKSLLEDYKKGIMQKIFNQEIRFKDDNGNDFEDWEIKTLGEVADFFKGKGLPKNHIKDDGKFKCIHYGELFTKYNELIKNVISKTDIYDKPFLSIANDVLMPTSDVTPNGLATASCIVEDGVILGGDVLIIRQKQKVLDGLFLSFYIAQFREKVMKLVSGSTVYHLYGSDMKNLEVFIPCFKEQTKIANFLSAIDEKIELVSNQIQDTLEYKKGLLQQMFV